MLEWQAGRLLSLANPEIGTNGLIDMSALFNAICTAYPKYTAAYNEEHASYERSALIREKPGVGTKFIIF